MALATLCRPRICSSETSIRGSPSTRIQPSCRVRSIPASGAPAVEKRTVDAVAGGSIVASAGSSGVQDRRHRPPTWFAKIFSLAAAIGLHVAVTVEVVRAEVQVKRRLPGRTRSMSSSWKLEHSQIDGADFPAGKCCHRDLADRMADVAGGATRESGRAEEVGGHLGRGGLAVGAGDRHERALRTCASRARAHR